MSSFAAQEDSQPIFTENNYLLVEDSPVDAEYVISMLYAHFNDDVSVDTANTFTKALFWLKNHSYKAIILDLHLPDRSGISMVSEIVELHPTLPIVVLTGLENQEVAVQAINKGAQDYIAKRDVTPELLARCLRYAEERKAIELKLKNALKESADQNNQLEKLARHDFLTTLPNRAHFESSSRKMMQSATRRSTSIALIYFDINKFKSINDSFGHSAGDELLREVARRAKAIVRDTDIIARLGGDEFVVMAEIEDDKSECYALVDRLLTCFSYPFDLNGQQIGSAPSVGISFFPEAQTLDILIQQADLAMYEAKRNGRHVCFFTDSIEATYTRSIQIKSNLKNAVEKTEFFSEFQAYYSSNDNNLVYVEALARWQSAELGAVPPNEFIPIVEHSPINNTLTQHIIKQCGSLNTLATRNNIDLGLINVNISASQLNDNFFCEKLLQWLDEANLSPDLLCLEITEREIVQNISHCGATIHSLRNAGIRIALDDFGSGYSSITHLISLPIDYLKLDRMLVHDINLNEKYQALNAGIIEMAHRLGMKVVAEGIETEEEYLTLKKLDCDFYQGWHFSRAQPIKDFVCAQKSVLQ